MKPRLAATALLLVALSTLTGAQTAIPAPVLPEALRWFSPPNNPAVHGAWVIGAENQAGQYILRVRLAPGARLPSHTHPDERNTTVLAGTLYVGFGEVFGETRVMAVPTGGVYVAPAGVAHYVWARDGEVVYQEAGVGPTGTVPVRP
jgi:quercetin dioxygenase-like cupin family protein